MATTYELIASQTLGSDTATVTFSSIPSTYDDLCCVVSSRSANAVATIGMFVRFNGDTNAANYSWRRLYGTGSGTGSDTNGSAPMIIPGDSATASTFGSIEIHVPNYAGSANKSLSATGVTENNATAAVIAATAGLWSSASAVTSMSLHVDSAQNFKTGSSFYLYGVTNADDGSQGYFGFAAKGGDEVFVTGDGYKVHVFKTSGTLEVTSSGEVECLVVAGGGGGGAGGGGGGAGGFVSINSSLSVNNYSITVGAGGSGGASGANNGSSGSNSLFNNINSIGGGGGGRGLGGTVGSCSGLDGGSGGGAGHSTVTASTGGSGISGQGNSGGDNNISTFNTGGGGGAGAAAQDAGSNCTDGGNGMVWPSGSNTYYAGGGGGGVHTSYSSATSGGLGGGGAGGAGHGVVGVSGTANTGGGGGGGNWMSAPSNGGAGGSGIVIIRYKV